MNQTPLHQDRNPKKIQKQIGRLTMAEVVLDAFLTVVVNKGLVTREEIQDQIIKQSEDN